MARVSVSRAFSGIFAHGAVFARCEEREESTRLFLLLEALEIKGRLVMILFAASLIDCRLRQKSERGRKTFQRYL